MKIAPNNIFKSLNKFFLVPIALVLSLTLTKDLCADSVCGIYKSGIDKVKYNTKHKDSKIILEEVLNLKESKDLYKGFGAKDEELEKKELIKAKFDKEETPFNNPFFLALIFFFALFCLVEGVMKKKDRRALLDISIKIPKIPIKFRKPVIISALSIALILSSFFNYNVFNGEAFVYTSLVKDLVDGTLKANPIDYADCGYMGAIPVLSFLTLPFFIMFNGTHFSLLVVCLLLKLVILILLYSFAYRFFGPITAAVSAFLFVFSTQEFTRFSMVGINATQFHTILFVLSFVYMYFTIFFKNPVKAPADNSRVSFLFLLLGLLGGVGIYFDPSILIIITFCSFYVLLYERKNIFKKHYLIYFLSLFLGLSPRIFNMFTHNMEWVNTEARFQTFFSLNNFINNILGIFPNFFRVFFFNLRRSFLENANPPYIAADIIYLLFFVSFCALLTNALQKRAWQDKRNFFLPACIIFYLVVVSFLPSDKVRTRYLVPLFPFIYILIGSFLETIFKLKSPFNAVRNSMGIVVVFCILLAGTLNIREAIDSRLGIFIKSPDARRVKGYSIIGYMDKLKGFAGQNIYLQDLILCGMRPSHLSSHLLLGVYIGDKLEGDLSLPVSNLIQYCIDPEYITLVYKGLAISYTNRFFNEIYLSFKKGAVSKAIPKEFQQYFYANFGFRIGKKYKNDTYKAISLIDTFPEEYKSYIYRGLILSLDEKNLQKLIKGKDNYINKSYRPLLFRQLGMVMSKDRHRLRCIVKEMPEEYASFFLQGTGGDWSMEYENHPYFVIKKRLEWLQSASKDFDGNNIKYFYEGVGLGAGIREAMFPGILQEAARCILDKQYLTYFYKGYGRGLFIQSMDVSKVMKTLLKAEVEDRWLEFCYDGARKEAELINEDTAEF